MKHIALLTLFCSSLASCQNAQQKNNPVVNTVAKVTDAETVTETPQKYTSLTPTALENDFMAVYKQYPNIPKGLLEAIAYDRTKIFDFYKIADDSISFTYGIYGLTKPKIDQICKSTKQSSVGYRENTKLQILTIAAELTRLKKTKGHQIADYNAAVDELFGYYKPEAAFKASYPGNATICAYLVSGFETREVKVAPQIKLLHYYNSIRPLGDFEDDSNRHDNEKQ